MAWMAMPTTVLNNHPPSLLPSSSAPLLEALKRTGEERVAAFHFPGHGRGSSAPSSISKLLGAQPFQFDLPELPGLDNLHSPQEAIAEAQQMAAELFGAGYSWFLVNGSTCGIQAAVMSCCKPGDVLILPRNAHVSAFSAMVLAGAMPHYVLPCYDELWEISHGVSAESIELAILDLQKRKDVRIGAVLIVSPTYFGVCSPVEEIAKVCHEHGIPIIVDEAHGAHFKFHSRFPATALEQGADVVVQSTHKVLSSLTQSGMLHLARGCEIVKHERISKCLRTLQSSSPSYLLLASLDAARDQMSCAASDDHPLFDTALELASTARRRLKQIPQVLVLDRENVSLAAKADTIFDELRITIGLWELGVTGTFADDFLCDKCKVVAELPLLNSITFAMGTGTSSSDTEKLIEGFQELLSSSRLTIDSYSRPGVPDCYKIGWKALVSPREAFFAETYCCKADEAVGLASAELVCPYPPGISVLFPGELVSQEALAYLKQAHASGITISGASDPTLSTLHVLK
ncbi:uncharacterized protein LOC112345639 [Selaginella moellendorffii]|uniref:uncharacterized protein LOC112345639 n=1 Tax=Selaginella moellendorffii TaxID=88036 RepID=UPI000D1CFF68|nr:uncharacterized protein LOC112345639 [Selaginella moellendorffii]|eukprot:XP_024528594.1 uncharacterized protein LOC112345639 [Selaginella moellendorffii]